MMEISRLYKSELKDIFSEKNEPSFRAKQLFEWLHGKRVTDFSQMTNLPAVTRGWLASEYTITRAECVRRQRSSDGTEKYLLSFADGNCVETVAMLYEHGLSVCVSTQVGCRMGCRFCASTQNGLWLIQESVRQWQREGRPLSYGELEEMASLAEPLVSFIDPDAPEFTAAGNMPEKIRKYCARTGQKVPESPGEIACTINQSLAMKYRKTLEEIEQTTGKTYPVIHLIGGGIKSKMLCRMTAEAAGRRVVAGPVEATALGNIAVQLIALGEIRDIAEARRIIASSEETAEYFPQNAEKWEEAYARFREIIG